MGIVCQYEGEYGDRRSESVFNGRKLDEDVVRASLDACLLTDDEMVGGPEVWAAFADSLLEWPSPARTMAGQTISGDVS